MSNTAPADRSRLTALPAWKGSWGAVRSRRQPRLRNHSLLAVFVSRPSARRSYARRADGPCRRTSLNSPIGERLRRVRRFLDGEPMFLANYADVLTNAPLPDMIGRFGASDAVASLLAVPPQSSHHVVDIGEDGIITQVTPMQDLRQWENGGYFLLRPGIFDHLHEGEDLVEDALMRRLVPQGRVLAYAYKGYWSPADTVKERAQLEEMHQRGNCPWMIWDPERSGIAAPVSSPAPA